jgi:methionyl-tRNA formyltransferase
MNFALFAADEVGREIIKFLKSEAMAPAALVLDSRDPKNLNLAMRNACDTDLVFESDELYGDASLAALRAAHLELIILAWWPYIIKPEIIQIPRLGCLNFHPSLLPYGRGKDPNFWNLVEQSPYGVSIHFIDEGIDSGDIAFQKVLPTNWEDTGQTLHQAAKRSIMELFKENFSAIIRGDIPRKNQDLTKGSFHRRSEIEPASKIELDQTYSARSLLNLFRARTFPPHPAAWFEEHGERYEVRVEIRRVKNS